MIYVGIDIGKRTHVASAMDQRGSVCFEKYSFSMSREGFDKLDRRLRRLSPKEEVRVACEASGPYWLPVFETLTRMGYEVIVANPLQIAAFRNQGIRGSKTDGIDSLLIAKVLMYGEIQPCGSQDSKLGTLRILTRHRAELGVLVSRLKRNIINVLDVVFPEYHQAMPKTRMFTRCSMELLAQACTPDEWQELDVDAVYEQLDGLSRRVFKKAKMSELKKLAKTSIGSSFAQKGLVIQLRALLDQLKFTLEQEKALEAEVKRIHKELNDTLVSIPGVGTLIAATIRAELGDLKRFEHKKSPAVAMVAFAGLDPKLHQSGGSEGKTRMSKRGSHYLRKALYQAAHVASQRDPMFRKIYETQKSRGKHHTVALSFVARKLLHVSYSLLKTNLEYQPMMN